MNLAQLELPAHIHVEETGGRDVVSGEIVTAYVVWADRPTPECPGCGQDIGVEQPTAPAMLNMGAGQGGQVEEFSQQHGCGEWVAVAWVVLEDDLTPEHILTVAEALAWARNAEIAAG